MSGLGQNRFSLAPQRTTNWNFESNNKLLPSHSRLSSINYACFNQRNTTISFKNDPRPITDSKFKEASITKIFNFLIKESFDKNISMKNLQIPTKNDFLYIFYFILKKIRKDFISHSQNEEEVLAIINELKYPGQIRKSYLSAVGAPNTWPYLVGLLVWMVELADYIQSFEEENLMELRPLSTKSDDIFFHDYVQKAYVSLDCEKERNEMKGKFEKEIEQNIEIMQHNLKEIESINEKIKEVKQSAPNKSEIYEKFQDAQKNLLSTKSMFDSVQKEINEIITENTNKNALYEEKKKIVENVKKQKEELEENVQNQKISLDSYNKMKETKKNLDLQYQTLFKKKEDFLNKISQIQNHINEKKQNLAHSPVNSEQIEVKNMEIDKLIQKCEDGGTNSNAIKNEFDLLNQEINQLFLQKEQKKKENENILSSLQVDLMKLEDEISSSSIELAQKQNDLSFKETEISKEKNQEKNFYDYYKDEINRISEQTQKCMSCLSELEGKIVEIKKNENFLKDEYTKKEIETEQYIKELDDTFNDTINIITKIKSDNNVLVQQSYQILDGVFLKLKEK